MPHIPQTSNGIVAPRPKDDIAAANENTAQHAGRDVTVTQARTPSMQQPAVPASLSNIALETAAYKQFRSSVDTARQMAEIDYAQNQGVDLHQLMDTGFHFAKIARAAFKDAFIQALNRGDKKSDALKFACKEANAIATRTLMESDLPGRLNYVNFIARCELKFENVKSQYIDNEHIRVQYQFRPAPQKPPRTFAYDAELAALKNAQTAEKTTATQPVVIAQPNAEAVVSETPVVAQPIAPVTAPKHTQRSFRFRKLPKKAARGVRSILQDLLHAIKSKFLNQKANAQRVFTLKPELISNPAYNKTENIFDVLLKSKHVGIITGEAALGQKNERSAKSWIGSSRQPSERNLLQRMAGRQQSHDLTKAKPGKASSEVAGSDTHLTAIQRKKAAKEAAAANVQLLSNLDVLSKHP